MPELPPTLEVAPGFPEGNAGVTREVGRAARRRVPMARAVEPFSELFEDIFQHGETRDRPGLQESVMKLTVLTRVVSPFVGALSTRYRKRILS